MVEEQDNFLYSGIVKKFKNNNNWVAAFVGPTGSGKSWGALKVAHDLSKMQGLEFKPEQICFTPKEFYALVEKRINNELPVGTIIVFDEAGIALDADASRSEEDIVGMKHIVQTFRKYRLGLIFTIPSGFGFMQKKLRQLVDFTFIMRDVNYSKGYSIAKCHWLQTNEYSGKIYRHNPVDFEDDSEMSSLKIYKPPLDLIEAYERKKDDFARSLLKEKQVKAAAVERKEKAQEQGLNYYYTLVAKNPEDYLSAKRDKFSYGNIMVKLGLSEKKAKALSMCLNTDRSNGKIRV